MVRLRPASLPPVGLDRTSSVLATIALALFFMPVLAIPIGIAALLAGAAGLVAALGGWASSLRWSVAGVTASLVALSAAMALWYSSSGDVQSRSFYPGPALGRPSVPPPARPNWWLSVPSAQSEGRDPREPDPGGHSTEAPKH